VSETLPAHRLCEAPLMAIIAHWPWQDSIEQVVRGLDVPAARLHQLTRAEALQIGVAAGPLIAGRGVGRRAL
jgi:hypothetical protein